MLSSRQSHSIRPPPSHIKIPEDHILRVLKAFIKQEKPNLNKFYPTGNNDDKKLNNAAKKGAEMVQKLVERGCSSEMAVRFSTLTLYDLVVLLDDSDTMVLEENGERCKNLKKILKEVIDIYSLARAEGIVSVRFFNTRKGRKNVTPEKTDILSDSKVSFTGMTMIGTQLEKKVLQPFVYNMGEPRSPGWSPQNAECKPVLVMVITDGNVEGETPGYLRKVINNCVHELQVPGNLLGSNAVAFYFSRIGNHEGAKKLIEELDNDEALGRWIDCFPVNKRLEEVNSKDKNIKWLALQKLLLGALYKDIDENDEGRGFEDKLSEKQVAPMTDPQDNSDDEE